MVLDEFYKLNNGQRIPKIALGTWQTPNDVAATAVATAIDAGYRHIDTAIAYENEAGVGAGLKAALKSTGIHRESIFITTKIPAIDGPLGCVSYRHDAHSCSASVGRNGRP